MGWKSLGIYFSIVVICVMINVADSQNWRGNVVSYYGWQSSRCKRCICLYGSYCGWWRNFTCNALVRKLKCARGWGHRGDYNCIIPICSIGCGSVGECTAPETCDCKGLAIGKYCQTLVCSYATPCYPGNCYNNNKCNCTAGYTKEPGTEYGCLKMDTNNKPFIGRSTTVIEHIRRTDNSSKFLFNFYLDGTDESPGQLEVWSNQRIFNEMHFYFEVTYEPPEALGDRPLYVHTTKVGITTGRVLLRVLDYKNEIHPKQQYDIDCPSTPDDPELVFNCTKRNEEFKTLIEHADTLRVTFEATNGGFRDMTNQGNLMPRERFKGQTSLKHVYFKFDFQAPKSCTQGGMNGYTYTDCNNATMLEMDSEFTKDPIRVRWKGWTDDQYGSQMWMYYLELHKLVVEDATLKLTERDPIGPMATNQTQHMGNMSHYKTFTPLEPGMYSVLLEVRDVANNSLICRRFVLYDKESDVELNQESTHGLHVSSAQNRTGYNWQSSGTEGGSTEIVVDWTGYFMNKVHEDGHYNNGIKQFKPQFEDLEDDGVLFTRKFVGPELDDNEGERTLAPVDNIHGIVKFEYQFTKDINAPLPGPTWTTVFPLQESATIKETMKSGDQLKIWVRGQDVLGNNKTAYTTVTTDFTKPFISDNNDNKTTYMVPNSNKGPFNYSSSLFLEAYDTESGVRELGVSITIRVEGIADFHVMKFVKAHTDDKRHPDRDSTCVQSRDKSTCFLKDQTVYMDNCWLTVTNQLLLPSASATIEVIAYNQAMLSRSVIYEVPAIKDLDGLVAYNGPETAKIVAITTASFRVVWDFPKEMSCYAIQTAIIITLYKKKSKDEKEVIVTKIVPGSAAYFDVAKLESNTKYYVNFTSKIGDKENPTRQLSATTEAETEPVGLSVGVVVGIAVAVILIVVIVVIIFIFLIRRGYIHPQERARRVKRAVTKKYRQTVYGDSSDHHLHAVANTAYDAEHAAGHYDNRKTMSETEELYLYGGMDINMPEVKHIDRNDISFEGIIKDGHFARIYKGTWRTGRRETTVVAKTLKDKFTPEDEMLMRAKINFTGTVVGDHPNVLKFLGAVVGDDQMGPFIVYEYCENGTLKDYLVKNKRNVSLELQEHLYRFGLDVAKGMEYLASKGIVHRRLAARNILLTFLNEIKISGFGPQPDASTDGDAEKQERIPIKWVAPECMTSTKDATERSDIWSYAVVLWEIFTLGDTPYTNMKSRQIPIALKKGERLPKPEQCDDTWHGVMKRCWEYDPHKRPLFADVRSELDEMFVASPGDDYYYYKR